MSALAYDSPDLFHSIAGDPDPLVHTPFDALCAQAANQEHVAITAQNAAWIRSEIELAVSGVAPGIGLSAATLMSPAPGPARGPLRIALALPRLGDVDLRVLAVDGREVARLASGVWAAGPHEVTWSGDDRPGRAAPAGVSFVRLVAGDTVATPRLVRFR